MTGVPVARDAGTERDSDGNSDSDSDGETPPAAPARKTNQRPDKKAVP